MNNFHVLKQSAKSLFNRVTGNDADIPPKQREAEEVSNRCGSLSLRIAIFSCMGIAQGARVNDRAWCCFACDCLCLLLNVEDSSPLLACGL